MYFCLVCNTPAILSFDPFPNYRPSTIDTVTRHKREVEEDVEEEQGTKDDELDLQQLRQQVDDVLQKVCTKKTF